MNAMTLPASLAMGNMTRLRNLEYMRTAAVGRQASGFSQIASGLSGFRLSAFRGSECQHPRPGPSKDGRTADGCIAVFLLPRKQSALAENFFAEFVFQAVAQEETGIGGVADAELRDHLFVRGRVRRDIRGRGRLRDGAGIPEKTRPLARERRATVRARRASFASPGVE